LTTNEKINYSLSPGITPGASKIRVTFSDNELDGKPEDIAQGYREAGWQVSVNQTEGKTTFEFS